MYTSLKAKRLAVWKLPERWEIRDEFPMMPSSKIRHISCARIVPICWVRKL
jgi:hypothetical protein